MENFKHIIITRFNLSKRWQSDKLGNTVLDENWLKDRFYLFENYCLPSIKSQTCLNFEWWVYFDEQLSPEYKKKNEALHSSFANFIPKYEKSYNYFETNMPKELHKKLLKSNVEWLITTRLDNDDILAKNTVEVIQKHISFKGACLLEIPVGYTMEIGEKSVLRQVTTYLNPFISLVETVSSKSQVKSVYYQEHNKWKGVKNEIVSNLPQWIQVIHDKNISNSAAGKEINPWLIRKQFKFNYKSLKFKSQFRFYKQKIYGFMTGRIKRKIREFQDRFKNLDKKADLNYQLIEDEMALNQLLKMFDNNVFVPLTGWSISPKEVLHICNDIVINKRKNIIEFGSGYSTVCIAQLLKNNNLDATFFSVESNPEWAEELNNILGNMNLDNYVKIVIAPLKNVDSGISKECQDQWYSTESLSIAKVDTFKYDLVVVDGPPGFLTPYSRYSAIPFLKNNISKTFAVFLDDANRSEEKEISNDWHLILGGHIKGYNRYCYLSDNLDFDTAPFGNKF
ncbi:glycosyltransferase [Thalassobellus citreus]|uniref:glycosyltransferase n=1 Tax=Thalassobellus citreus TaxID=3367752 RepID=UPI0037A88EA7